jgi:AraC-like DNA-binding protein
MEYQQELELFQRGTKLAQQLYNCHICVHDFSNQIVENVKELPVHHLNPFCTFSKRSGTSYERRCIMFDGRAVAERLAQTSKPFWKSCHSGIIEAVIPVFMDNRNIGILFIGPFRQRSAQIMPQGSLIASPVKITAQSTELSKHLPELSLIDFNAILTLGELLARQLENLLIKAAATATKVKDRKQQIEDFFNENFHRNIALSDLAEQLCLSESRAFQLLKKYFNQGFSTMLMNRRLLRAEKLLRRSMFSIGQVAAMTGFQSNEYFCRVFKRKYGKSARVYRTLHAHKSLK